MKIKFHYLIGFLSCLIFTNLKAQVAYTYTTSAESFAGILTPTSSPVPNCDPIFSTTIPLINTTSTHTLSTTGTWTADGAFGMSGNGNPSFAIRLNRNNANAGTNNINGSLITPKLAGGATTLTFDARMAVTGGSYPKSVSVYKIVNGVESPTAIFTFTWASNPGSTPYSSITVPVNTDSTGLSDFKLRIRNTSNSVGSGNNDIFIDNILVTRYSPVPFLNTVGAFSAFTQNGFNNPTAGQKILLTGANLTNEVVATAPADFQVSKDSSTWSSTVTYSVSGGKIVGDTVALYVRLNSSATIGAVAGSLALSSTGATAVSMTVSGVVIPAYYLKTGLGSSPDVSVLSNFTDNATGGSGNAPANFTADATFFVNTSTNATLGADVSLGLNVKFVIGNGTDSAALIIPTGRVFTGRVDVSTKAALKVDGTLINNTSTNSGNASGTIIVNGSHNLTANGAVVFNLVGTPVINYSTNSTVNVTGATTTLAVFQNYSITNTTAPTILNVPVGNVVWNCTGQATAASFVSGTGNATLFVQGNFTVQSTGSSHLLVGNGVGGRTMNVAGNLIINAGEFRVAGFNATASSNSANANCFVTGNVEVATGATLVVSASAGSAKGFLYVKGNIVNNGTISNISTNATYANGNRGIIVLNGTASQSISTASDFVTGGNGRVILHLNNDGIVTLNNPITIDSLFITKGRLSIGNNDVTIGMPNGVLDTAATFGHVITQGTGFVVMPVNTTVTSYLLPVGGATAAKPATITFNAAPTTGGTLRAKYDETFTGATLAPALTVAGITPVIDKVNAGQWEINNNGIVFGSYTISATSNAETSISTGQLTNTTLLQRPNNGTWASNGTHITTTGTESAPILSRSGLTTFSQFGLAGNAATVLPIFLQSFNGAVANGMHILHWSIINTSSNNKIELEYSNNGTSFTHLYSPFISNNREQQFSYTNNSISGIVYYRLKTINSNGSVTYSSIIQLKSGIANFAIESVYPTIATQAINVKIVTPYSKNAQLEFYNANGQKITTRSFKLNIGTTILPVEINSLQKGVYFGRIVDTNNATTNTFSFIKQ